MYGSSGLELFKKPPVQTAILRNYENDYYPIQTISEDGPIEFVLKGSQNEYIDVSDVNLYIKFKITDSTGGDLSFAAPAGGTTPDKVSVENLAIATLFQDVSLTLGTTQIEGGHYMYPYASYLSVVTQFTQQAKKTHLAAAGWYADTADKFNSETENKGHAARKIINNKSREIIGPVFLDFFRQNRYLLPDVSLSLKFTRAKPAFVIQTFDTTKTNYKIKIEEAILYVRRVEISPSLVNMHNSRLDNKMNALYPVQHTEIQTFTINKGLHSHIEDRLFRGLMPKLLYVCMVENDAFNGDITKNPFHFQQFNLNKIALYREGEYATHPPLEPNFTDNQYFRSYALTQRALGMYNTDDSNGLTLEDFAKGYGIYVFDLTADSSPSGDHIQSEQTGNLRIDLKFKSALSTTINVILYAVFDGNIEITKLRNVIPSYLR